MSKKAVKKLNMIRVIFAGVNKDPEVKMIRDNIKDFQLLVGGNVERIDFHSDIPGSNLYVNEEGIGMNLPLNRLWHGHYLLGDIFVSKSDESGEEEIGLTEEEAQKIIALLSAYKNKGNLR
jgi:hypothetical protein